MPNKLINSIRKRYVEFFPDQIVTRSGVKYHLDCRELIDLSIYIYDQWENDTRKFIETYVSPGKTIVEIGANVGAHTLSIARAAGVDGHVYAVEPTQFARTKLERNIALNPDLANRITVLDYLIAEKSETEQRRDIRSSWPTESAKTEQGTETVQSRVISIDDLCAEYGIKKVDIIKIDVDGYDFKAISGAMKIIERDRPVVIIELAEWALEECGASVTDILNFFSSVNYEGYNAEGLVPISNEDIQKMTSKEIWMNGVFLPPE